MMRFTFLRHARKDMTEMLLRRGRLVDMQMLNFYSNQVDGELEAEGKAAAAASDAATASATTTTATTAGDTATAAAVVAAAAARTVEERIATLAQEERRAAFDAFNAQRAAVARLAATAGPVAWMGEAYGTKEWSTSHLSHSTVKVTSAKADATGKTVTVTLSGSTTAAGGSVPASGSSAAAAALPECVQVIVRIPRGGNKGGGKKDEPLSVDTATAERLPEYLATTVKLNQPNGAVTATLVNGLLELHFKEAAGLVKTANVAFTNANGEALEVVYTDPSQVAARQHVLTAAAYAGMLGRIEEVAALHATSATRYDGFLVKNHAVQMRLSQIACFKFGIESLADYVAGEPELDAEDGNYARNRVLLNSFVIEKRAALKATAEAATVEPKPEKEDGAEQATKTAPGTAETAGGEEILTSYLDIVRNERTRLYTLPLMDSVVLNIYAENALMDGIDCAWHIVRDHPLDAAVPHSAKPEKLIDYPYLSSIFSAPKYSVTSADGSMELRALEFVSPLLSPGGSDSGGGGHALNSAGGIMGRLSELAGLTSAGRLRLTGPHTNVRIAATTVEQDLHSLLAFIDKERIVAGGKKTSNCGGAPVANPAFVFCVASYLAELMANVAVLYRCTASLTADEDGRGHREWLLAQCFTSASNARRSRYLADYHLMRAAARSVGAEERYSTHPVELMNTAARKKEEEDDDTEASSGAGKKAKAAPKKKTVKA